MAVHIVPEVTLVGKISSWEGLRKQLDVAPSLFPSVSNRSGWLVFFLLQIPMQSCNIFCFCLSASYLHRHFNELYKPIINKLCKAGMRHLVCVLFIQQRKNSIKKPKHFAGNKHVFKGTVVKCYIDSRLAVVLDP